jgi:hypothetical protein
MTVQKCTHRWRSGSRSRSFNTGGHPSAALRAGSGTRGNPLRLGRTCRQCESGLEFAGFGEAELAFGQGEGEEFLDFGLFAVAGHG